MATGSLDLITACLGQYRVEALIGRGGMGEVYRARDSILGRAVALKVLPSHIVEDADRLSRFVQEARAASALNHPHVVAIYEIRQAVPTRDGAAAPKAPSVHYIAMELVTGDTIRALIDQRRLDLKRTLEIFAQIADALAAAHAVGVIHRDLKPENLMVAEGGYAKVLDFGLAKLKIEPALNELASQYATVGAPSGPGVLLGTVGYMAPEQAQGRGADHRSDIFAFGCVLYEAAAGVRAFSGPSAIDTLHRIVNEEPAPITAHAPGAPAELQRIVRKCLTKEPADRYQSMKEVAIDLRDLRRQLDSGSGAAAIAERSAGTSRRRGPSWIGAAALAVVLAAGWFAWREAGDDAPTLPMRIERVTASGNVTDASLSADGKYVAYTESRDGLQSLWVRQVDGTNALELIPPRPVGYWGTSFAADGAAIFYAVKGPDEPPGGSLYRIPLLGGTPRRLLEGIDSAVTLSPDGRQLAYVRADYPERGGSALMVAGADGTNPRPLTMRRPPQFFAPGFFVHPSWSPDGTRLVTAMRNSQTRDAALVTVAVADGTEQLFPTRFTEVGFAEWLPDGSGIVFVGRGGGVTTGTGGQIWLQPYPDGVVRRLTNDLIDYRNASVSADGISMVSVGLDVAPALWVLPLDGRDEASKLPSLRYDGAAGVAWMPDGRIVFSTLVRGQMQIWMMDADGSNRHALTTEGASAWPRPSPDGRSIAFAGSRGSQIGIWRMNADGADTRLLAPLPGAIYLNFTPDGRWITFTSSLDGSPSLWRVSSEGGTPERLIPELERSSVSPDGQRVVGIHTVGSRFGLAILPIGGGEPQWLPNEVPLATGGGIFEWTHDGGGVFFTTAERSNLWLSRLGEPKPVKVTNFTEATLLGGDLSPDGRSMVVSRGIQTRDAFLITNFR